MSAILLSGKVVKLFRQQESNFVENEDTKHWGNIQNDGRQNAKESSLKRK